MSRILVVDDSHANLKLACDILELEGHEVLRADGAEPALAVLETERPELVLMDISMPGMDGLTLTRRLRADARTSAMTIVALTASAMKGDEERVLAAGCDGYISKPIDTRAFARQVGTFLENATRDRKVVLVVDDDVTNRKLLRSVLEPAFAVVEAVDGIDALEQLLQKPFDAVLSDVLMPRMDGYRLCSELRRSEALWSMPFLVYTSTYTSSRDEDLAHKVGVDRYLIKPAPARTILEAVREAMGRTRVRAPLSEHAELDLMKEYNQQLNAKLEERTGPLTQLENDDAKRDRWMNAFFSSAAAGLCIFDADFRIVQINDTLAGANQLPARAHVGRTVREVLPNLAPAIEARLARVLATGEPLLDVELSGTLLDDPTFRHWIASYFPLDGATGSRAVGAVVVEVTQRKNAEEALRQSESKFRQLAENIPEVFWITTLDSSEIVYVSPAYESIWGRPIEELYATPSAWMDAIVPEDRAHVGACFAMLGQGAPEASVEYRVRRPDGSIRWMLDRGFPILDASGRVYRIAGIAKDVTERKSTEESLSRSQKMEAIGQLAGGIAHDFNNILGCIVGYTELAALATGDSAEARNNLEQVLEGCQRAKELILQIVAFSGLEEQGRRPLRLEEVVKESFKLLRASLPTTVTIRAEMADDVPPVLANATQVQQVLMNLATNAAQAMQGVGDLELKLAALDVDAEFARTHLGLRTGRHALLTVTDTGCGMDRATLQRLFEPFFTTKGPGEGMGLGLAVVHGIVKRHEGAIAVYSEPGLGTTFRLYLPGLESSVEEPATNDRELPRGNGELVLLVDDEPTLGALGRKVLEHVGYVVDLRMTALDALAAFRARPDRYAVVVTDLAMPDMSGVDLAGEIRQLRPDVPVILATGFGGAMISTRAQELGIREVLMKPATAQTLTAAVQRALSAARGVPR